jgi:hypothetical protein
MDNSTNEVAVEHDEKKMIAFQGMYSEYYYIIIINACATDTACHLLQIMNHLIQTLFFRIC